MARTLDQIIAELNPTFQPQVQSLQQQQQLIPQEIASQESALNAQKDNAYEDIVSGARRRGLGFSGIPLGEQAKYAATTYAPALAGLRQQGNQKAMSLQDAILGINERRDTLGQQIYQTEQDRATQERAAAAANAQPTWWNDPPKGDNTNTTSTLPKINRNSSGGYAFTDAYGKPINAAEYVQLYNSQGGKLGYRELLSQMASTGDKNAKIALQYVGNDAQFGNAPASVKAALTSLGATGTYGLSQQQYQQQSQSALDKARLFSNPTQFLASKLTGGR